MAILGRIPRDDSALRGVQSFMNAFMQSKRLQLKQENIDFTRERIKEQDTFDREDRERKVKEKNFLADFIFNTEQNLVDDRNKARFEEEKVYFKEEKISFNKEAVRGLPVGFLNILAKNTLEAPKEANRLLIDFLKFKKQTSFREREITVTERPRRAPGLESAIVGAIPEEKRTVERLLEIKKSISKAGATTITLPTDKGKKLTDKLQEESFSSEEVILELEEVGRLYKPEFLQFIGQGKAFLQSIGDKFGDILGSLGYKVPTEFLERRSAFIAQAKKSFFVYRKWVTGVAGGEKEFKEIAKAVPDPDRDSPAQFESKRIQTLRWIKILRLFKQLKLEDPKISITDTKQFMIDNDLIKSDKSTQRDIDLKRLESLNRKDKL